LIGACLSSDCLHESEATMIYAIRTDGQTRTLIEVPSREHTVGATLVSDASARQWVLAGRLHETGLWIDRNDDGAPVVRYAEPEGYP
jgi:hypothetical protein